MFENFEKFLDFNWNCYENWWTNLKQIIENIKYFMHFVWSHSIYKYYTD